MKILNETENHYEVKYVDRVKGDRFVIINGLDNLVKKQQVYDIHEKNLNWFQRNL